MKFIFEIELSSNEMQSRRDVAAALRAVALQFQQTIIGRTGAGDSSPIRDGEYGLIRNINGDTVGKWEVTDTPVPSPAQTPHVFTPSEIHPDTCGICGKYSSFGKHTVSDPIDRMYAEAFEDEDDPDQTMTEQCRRGTHDGCPDVDANCCECSCHLPTPPDATHETYELILRWGRPDEEDERREAKVYTFETEAERDAYRDGIIEAQPDTTRFDFYTRNADGTIPEDEEWNAENEEDE